MRGDERMDWDFLMSAPAHQAAICQSVLHPAIQCVNKFTFSLRVRPPTQPARDLDEWPGRIGWAIFFDGCPSENEGSASLIGAVFDGKILVNPVERDVTGDAR